MLRNSWWSYWCHTHDLSAIVGDASNASSSAERSAPAGNRAASTGAGSAALARVELGGTSGGTVVDGAVAEALRPARRRSGARSDDASARGVAARRGRVRSGHTDRVEEAVVHAEARGVGDAPDRPSRGSPTAAQRSSTASRLAGVTIASIRSWLSDVITSTGFMPGSRLAMRAMSTSMPAPVFAAVSDAAHEMPAAPRSCTPDREAGVEQLEARLDGSLLLERVTHLHRRVAWPRSLLRTRPTRARWRRRCRHARSTTPSSTARLSMPSALASTRRSFGSRPRHSTFTSGLSR